MFLQIKNNIKLDILLAFKCIFWYSLKLNYIQICNPRQTSNKLLKFNFKKIMTESKSDRKTINKNLSKMNLNDIVTEYSKTALY